MWPEDTALTQNGAQPARAPFRARIGPFAVGAAGIALLLLAYYAHTWNRITAAIDVCVQPFCDFVDYYYPMGEAIFRTGFPEPGFLYSPFVAILSWLSDPTSEAPGAGGPLVSVHSAAHGQA